MLLEKYKINPPPYVIELDEHPHGVELQKALGKATGRTTVPVGSPSLSSHPFLLHSLTWHPVERAYRRCIHRRWRRRCAA